MSPHLWEILRLLYSGSVVGYRSALCAKPTPEGKMFLVGAYPRTDKLPGSTVRVLEGTGPLPGDIPNGGGIYLTPPARALLECLSGKRITAESPTLPRGAGPSGGVSARTRRVTRCLDIRISLLPAERER